MSRFAHVPYTLGILALAIAIGLITHSPVSTLFGWFGGLIFCLTREETQREYQIIQTLNPPLRRMLKETDAFKFWNWTKHSLEETVVALLFAAVVAVIAHIAFGL
jgi:ABC-type nitrate/sulfonate/bicarbonate transport system permease component